KNPQRYLRGLGSEELTSSHIGAIAEANLVRENVRGSGRKDAENDGIRRSGVPRDAVDGLVDSAITAGSQNTLTTSMRRVHCELSSRIRTGGGEQFNAVPGALENLNRAIKPRSFRPPEAARKRVENN